MASTENMASTDKLRKYLEQFGALPQQDWDLTFTSQAVSFTA